MKKINIKMKKTAIFSVAAVALTAGVFAAGNIFSGGLTQVNKPEVDTQIVQPQLYADYNSPQLFDAQLQDEFENSVFNRLNRSGKSRNEIYEDIFNYKKFILMYNPSGQALAVIDNLIMSGADMLKVFEIYNFWQTACEAPEIIEDIYNLSGKYTGTYWIEEAYNEVTQCCHGVLNESQIHEYLLDNLSQEDIRMANILSRKGVDTINSILDSKDGGQTWESIISSVYGVSNVNAGLISKVTNSSELMQFILFRDTDFTDYIGESTSLQNFEELYSAIELHKDNCIALAHSELLTAGITKRIEDDTDSEAYIAYKEKILDNGITNEQMEEFFELGYTAQEVLDASESQKMSGESAANILEENRAEIQGEEAVLR